MIKRKTNGSIVCPSCGRLISANAKECIHCGRKNPSLWGFGPVFKSIMGNVGGMVPIITPVCIVLYILSLLLDISAIASPHGFLGFLAPSGKALFRLGMTGYGPIAYGYWWTLITAIYLHGGILHILFNLLWLRNLGYMVEEFFGVYRAFIIFTVSGVVGFIASNVALIPYTIGASGSVFGLLGALIYFGRKRGGYLGSAVYRQVGIWAVIAFLFGFMIPGINNVAHIGGFIGGYLTAMGLGFHDIKRETKSHRMLSLSLAVLTIVCFFIVFVRL